MTEFAASLKSSYLKLSPEDKSIVDSIFTLTFTDTVAGHLPANGTDKVDFMYQGDDNNPECTAKVQKLVGVGNKYTLDFTFYNNTLALYRANAVANARPGNRPEAIRKFHERKSEELNKPFGQEHVPVPGLPAYKEWTTCNYVAPRHTSVHYTLQTPEYNTNKWDVKKLDELLEAALLSFRVLDQTKPGLQTNVLNITITLDELGVIYSTPNVMMSETPPPFKARWHDAVIRHEKTCERNYSHDFILAHQALGLAFKWGGNPLSFPEPADILRGTSVVANLCASRENEIYVFTDDVRTPGTKFKEAVVHCLNILINEYESERYNIAMYLPPRGPDLNMGTMPMMCVINDWGRYQPFADNLPQAGALWQGGTMLGGDPFKLKDELDNFL